MYITTSWDDGHPFDLRLAELLAKHALPGTFYVPLRHTLPVLTAPQIRELGGQFEIGGHTVSHCDLLAVSDEVARREIAECKTSLENISGKPCRAFCFPGGRFRRRHAAAVGRAGFRLGRTVELMSIAGPRQQHGIALMPTTVQAAPLRLPVMARNGVKRGRLGNLLRYARFKRSDWVGTVEAILTHLTHAGGIFHLWGHSWEVAEMNQWANLDRALSLMAQCRGRARLLTNTELVERLSQAARL